MAKAPKGDPDFNPNAARTGILPRPAPAAKADKTASAPKVKTPRRPKDQPNAMEPASGDRPDWPPQMPLATNAPKEAPDPGPAPVDHALAARDAAFRGKPLTFNSPNAAEE